VNAATPVERVRLAVAEYLATPDSYPLIVPAKPDHGTEDMLARAHAKQERRRFTGEPITNFGSLPCSS
jgi:hypothetical protein